MWYWEEFLKVVLGSTEWGPNNVMYYKTIKKATTTTNFSSGKPLTTPMHEAKGITVWENNRDKWTQLHQWTKDNQGQKQPIYGGKWSPTDAGQQDNGAWTSEGIQYYKDTKKKVIEAWEADDKGKIKALEKHTLRALRKKHGLICGSHTEEQKHKKNNKRRAKNNLEELKEPKKPKIDSAYDEDDDRYD